MFLFIVCLRSGLFAGLLRIAVCQAVVHVLSYVCLLRLWFLVALFARWLFLCLLFVCFVALFARCLFARWLFHLFVFVCSLVVSLFAGWLFVVGCDLFVCG